LTASATGATMYRWFKNGSQVQQSSSTTYSVTGSGSYTVEGYTSACTTPNTRSSSKVVTIATCGGGGGGGGTTTVSYTSWSGKCSGTITYCSCTGV
jgi:hypothetical protein